MSYFDAIKKVYHKTTIKVASKGDPTEGSRGGLIYPWNTPVTIYDCNMQPYGGEEAALLEFGVKTNAKRILFSDPNPALVVGAYVWTGEFVGKPQWKISYVAPWTAQYTCLLEEA